MSDESAGRVLVLETHRRQGIVAVRTLGRHGLEVTAGSDERLNSGGFSRYASRRFQYPHPRLGETAFVDALERELTERQYDMLLPLTAVTVPSVVRNRERVEAHTTLPFLPFERLEVGLDKAYTFEAAREAGVPAPATLAPTTLDLDAVATEIGYPAVVKPRRAAGGFGVHVCESPDELERVFEEVRAQYGPSVIQEFVPNGGEVGVYTIYDCSSTLTGVTVQRRLRTNPPGGGASTLRETIAAPELVAVADRLFTSIDWKGVAMAEFRVDPRDGKPKLLEVNPRLWGSLALSVFAGVEFPYLLYQLATTGHCESSLTYRVGVQARNLTGDIGHLLAREDKARALREVLGRDDAPRTDDVLALADPLPGACHLFRAGSSLVASAVPLPR
ncbi:ATP-grasp domain-containing protein [Halobellus rarus]|uniref:ATP-grasp domain-containing protein n=1 Tax=Halobellus rarus TaxID=1126237 RepID=A0ABD6CJV5_9EURY|nr:ATP-grasp domain-containing protein [Halobellus rarus]